MLPVIPILILIRIPMPRSCAVIASVDSSRFQVIEAWILLIAQYYSYHPRNNYHDNRFFISLYTPIFLFEMHYSIYLQLVSLLLMLLFFFLLPPLYTYIYIYVCIFLCSFILFRCMRCWRDRWGSNSGPGLRGLRAGPPAVCSKVASKIPRCVPPQKKENKSTRLETWIKK